MSAKISVIIPNYNHEIFLRQRIESVLNQAFIPFEIIILDDCSTDNSKSIIEEYVNTFGNIKFVENATNSGSTFIQWNKGVEMAKGDFIWIAESDDVAEPEFLERMVACLHSDPQIVLAYCQSNRMNEKGEIAGTWKDYTDDLDASSFNTDFAVDGTGYIERFLIHRNTIPNASAVVFKKSVYQNTGGAPAGIKNIGDWLTWLKVLCFGKVAFIAEPLNNFRYHSNSVIATANKAVDTTVYRDWYGSTVRDEFMRFIRKHKIRLSPEIKKVNASYLATDMGNKGLFYLKSGRYLSGWQHILKAMVFYKFQLGFLKKALFERTR